jgi:hypothetical protein
MKALLPGDTVLDAGPTPSGSTAPASTRQRKLRTEGRAGSDIPPQRVERISDAGRGEGIDRLVILRRLIAKGDPNGIPLAERAINEYFDATPASARKSGLRLLQADWRNKTLSSGIGAALLAP